MSVGLVVFLVVTGGFAALIVGSSIKNRAIVLEGMVMEKTIAQNDKEFSYLIIQTPALQRIVLRFGKIEDDDDYNAAELDNAVSLKDIVRVRTHDRAGITRDVDRLLSVSRPL